MAENSVHPITSVARWSWTTLKVLALFIVLLFGFNMAIHLALPPDAQLRVSYFTGGPDCADFARHLESNNTNGVDFSVMPMAESSTETINLCWLDLSGEVTSWDVGDANRPVVIAAQNFTPKAGSFNQDLSFHPVLGRWHAPLLLLLATLGTALWCRRRHRQRKREQEIFAAMDARA